MKDIEYFTKFLKLIDDKKIIYLDKKLNKINKIKTDFPFELKKYNIGIDVDNSIYIIYNKNTTYLECIFGSDIDYIQTSFFLNNVRKTEHYAKYFINKLKNVNKCLVIGLCLGTIPNALFSNKTERIDCIEINPVLCNLYKKFFKLSNKIHVFEESGVTFVERTKKKYDTIFIDIPCQFITVSFMNNIYRISNKGYIFINLIGKEYHKMNLKKIFEKFEIINSKIIEENFLYILKNIN